MTIQDQPAVSLALNLTDGASGSIIGSINFLLSSVNVDEHKCEVAGAVLEEKFSRIVRGVNWLQTLSLAMNFASEFLYSRPTDIWIDGMPINKCFPILLPISLPSKYHLEVKEFIASHNLKYGYY